MTAPAARTASAAGGVVFRRGVEGPEIVVVLRHAPPLVALPKGKPDLGESVEQTAIREVREETGLEARILEPLGEVRYWFPDEDGVRVDKVVTYFLMEATGGALELHDHEFDEVAWVHIAEAERRLSHRNQLHIIHRAAELIGKMPA